MERDATEAQPEQERENALRKRASRGGRGGGRREFFLSLNSATRQALPGTTATRALPRIARAAKERRSAAR